MNFTESFEQFSRGLQPRDLMLYAGAGIVLWVLFKDRMSPVQKFLAGIVEKVKSLLVSGSSQNPVVVVPVVKPVDVVASEQKSDDVFFRLVVSWKQTRDLAEESGCVEAVKVADQMFPFLSPNVCAKKDLS